MFNGIYFMKLNHQIIKIFVKFSFYELPLKDNKNTIIMLNEIKSIEVHHHHFYSFSIFIFFLLIYDMLSICYFINFFRHIILFGFFFWFCVSHLITQAYFVVRIKLYAPHFFFSLFQFILYVLCELLRFSIIMQSISTWIILEKILFFFFYNNCPNFIYFEAHHHTRCPFK